MEGWGISLHLPCIQRKLWGATSKWIFIQVQRCYDKINSKCSCNYSTLYPSGDHVYIINVYAYFLHFNTKANIALFAQKQQQQRIMRPEQGGWVTARWKTLVVYVSITVRVLFNTSQDFYLGHLAAIQNTPCVAQTQTDLSPINGLTKDELEATLTYVTCWPMPSRD